MARAKRGREEVEKWCALREREGLSLRALSERSGIPAGTLGWWNHELKKRPKPRRPRRRRGFVELLLDKNAIERGGMGQGFRVVLRSGHVVEVPQDFDPGSLTRLAEVLQEC